MSSSSATRGASTTYTFGVPGSQVKINLNKSGNHTLTLLRGSADKPFCKVCYDAGLPVTDYTSHFVKDQPGPNGKVVCPTLLAQKCLVCGIAGHTSSYCSQKNQQDAERASREREERERSKKANGGWETVGAAVNSKSKPRIEEMKPKTGAGAGAVVPPRKTYGGSFGALCVDDSSDDSEYEREQEEIRNTPANVPKPVAKEKPILTGPPPAIEPPKPLSWAQRAAAAAQKPVPSASSSSSGSSLKDTRFALHHAVCENIPEKSKRAPPRANQDSESSKKRKQDAAIVPA